MANLEQVHVLARTDLFAIDWLNSMLDRTLLIPKELS